ncbi:T9SS type A sorting domain-containing protein [Seonamhaeicola maritimus]|uniref:T9SS type A sorting domain-containing protein n=1 Tax=Seonamhaeicola maritimus TaxID=2591822 RepID=A0A5C7GGR6_9FLAO|nr:T9SS type A sorting domain-containing protein [Seonamhaeicola maritimus]TXG36066.1 T9SS type A sorting domain-containing protein [Seonamhaeicola maritimus]
MKHFLLVLIFLFSLLVNGQMLTTLIPSNTATHTAVQNGSWFSSSTWNTNTVPSDASIVVIPDGITVSYQGQSNAQIFAIRVDGEFVCTQTNTNLTTTLTFDTFIGTSTSYVKFLANNAADGKIDITITPFDIEAHKGGTSGFSQVWNSNATSHFSDGATTYKITQAVGPDNRFNSYTEALSGNTSVTETSRTVYDDGPGVTGRHQWDSTQLSLGIVTMGQIEIIGQEKLNMMKLAEDALKNQAILELESVAQGWKNGDDLIVTRGGNMNTSSNGEDEVTIQSISETTVTLTSNLLKNHEGRSSQDLHCYVGNLTRNITFKSSSISNVHHRGHLMAMHNDTNVQIRNASFIDMGRTDKSRLVDDFIWNNWLRPKVFNSKISALGQECAEMIKNDDADITNPRGRYSIHLHKTGASYGDNMTHVTGNVVWGNPGWGITQHDSHALVADNVVYDVIGAGIVSETGSETGFWDDNLVVNIAKGHNTDVYEAALFHDDYLFSGQGLAMKGRTVVCRGNVIANANQGVGVINMNPAINNLDRVDALALANRPGYEVDNFPLSVNGYSAEGDGVMPVEAALIMENTTTIWCYQGLRSIERDMGVNHESRSVFDGFKAWGVNQGLSIVYQADYSFKDVYISGKNMNAIGVFLWKHSHNQTFDNIKMQDLGYGVTVSRLVESGNGELKTRNNGFTPWYFIDLETTNVTEFYQIEKEDPGTTTIYTEHGDNTIHLSSSDFVNRPTTFTVLDSTGLVVDYATNDFRFEIDGIITDDFGSYDMGIKQAPAQGTLRLDYPKRIYEFASQAKFEEYLSNNEVYKDENDAFYFILNESLPNRRTYQYTKFPVRVNILNAPASGVYSSVKLETPSALAPKHQIISRFATVTQSSTDTSITHESEDIDASPEKAIDGNTNGRINVQLYQRGLVPVGSFSSTNIENEPWFDLDLGELKVIDFIDIWNTVELNGSDIEPVSSHFKDFYVLISDVPFIDSSLASSRALADYEYLKNSTPVRKFSLNNLGALGRYVRIQAIGYNKLKFAEVEIIGKKYVEPTLYIEKKDININVYPNPTEDKLNIKLGKVFNSVSVQVVNVLGQVVLSSEYKSISDIQMNLNVQIGLYIIKIKADDDINISKKIIVK